MIVRCKSDVYLRDIRSEKGITIDKSYVVIDIDNYGYLIIDDESTESWYSKELFHPIEIERDRKIEQILL
jgi:hypothetical protein